MFILLKTGAMLNLYWLQDCFVGKHDKNIVIFYMVNGSKIIEEYDSESEALKRVDDVHFMMDEASLGDTKPLIVDELPTENISTRRTYLVKISDDPEDGYQEWKYVEQPDGTAKWEMMGVSKDYSYSKEDIDTMTTELKNLISAETQARTTADTDLSNDLATETLARTNADTTLQTNIESEATTRETADNTIQENIESETTARTNADTLLQESIDSLEEELDAETQARTTADTDLQTQITAINEILEWQEY